MNCFWFLRARGGGKSMGLTEEERRDIIRSEYHTQLAKMSFNKIFDLTAGVYFNFYNNTSCCSLVVATYNMQGI